MLSFFCLTERTHRSRNVKEYCSKSNEIQTFFFSLFCLTEALRRYHFEYYNCKCKSNEIVIFIILVMIFLLYLTEGLRRSRNVQEYGSKSNEIQIFFFFLFCLTEAFRIYNFEQGRN